MYKENSLVDFCMAKMCPWIFRTGISGPLYRHNFAIASIVLLASILSACGGGSSSSTPAIETEDKEVSDMSLQELRTSYGRLAEDQYGGETGQAVITPRILQQFVAMGLPRNGLFIPRLDGELTKIYNLELHAGAIERTINCGVFGTMTVSGHLSENSKGNLDVEFSKCVSSSSSGEISGLGALSLLGDSNENWVLYFDDVEYSVLAETYQLSGLLESRFTNDLSTLKRYQKISVQFPEGAPSALLILDSIYDSTGNLSSLGGNVYIKDIGLFSVLSGGNQNPDYSPEIGKYTFTGSGPIRAVLEFYSQSLIKMLFDNNGDSSFDSGLYFGSESGFRAATVTPASLVPYADIAIRPVLSSPELLTLGATTENYIEIAAGTVSDQDTPNSLLTTSFKWSINGVEIVPSTSLGLNPFVAKKNDVVEVVMLVSDDVYTVSSAPLSFVIQDAPARLEISAVPESISYGDTLEFTALITDADEPADIPASFKYKPDGMTIDSSGMVRWVADDALFSTTQVYFALINNEATPSLEKDFEVEVQAPDVSLPLSRATLASMVWNNMIVVGNFVGSSDQEILVSDGIRVFLYVEKDGVYKQEWVYPYAFPSDGRISYLGAENLDSDAYLEVVVGTQRGVSILQDLDTEARLLFSTSTDVVSVTAHGSNEGAGPELAYLYEGVGGNFSRMLGVRDILSGAVVAEIPVSQRAEYLHFADIDSDKALELIVNTGEVFDMASVSNQWFFTSGFGEKPLSSGDFDGDGVDEIITFTGSDIEVFSALTKQRVGVVSHDTEICAVDAENIDSDDRDEILVGDCVFNVVAKDDALAGYAELWAAESKGFGVYGLTTGDVNLDGVREVYWASGYQSSLTLVVAEVDTGNTIWSNVDELQPMGFLTAGYGVVAGEGASYFTASSTRDGDLELPSVVSIDASGGTQVRQPGNAVFSYVSGSVLSDVDYDSEVDLVFTGFGLSAIRLDDYSEIIPRSSVDTYKPLVFDVNNDGFDDFIYVENGGTARVYDAFNQRLIGSAEIGGVITDVGVANFRDLNYPQIIIAATHKLTLWKVTGSGLQLQDEINTSCQYVEVLNIDLDSDSELACGSRTGQISVFSIRQSSLMLEGEAVIAQEITDMVVDRRSGPTQQKLVIGLSYRNNDFPYQDDNYIAGVDAAAGKLVWRSPRFLHSVQNFRMPKIVTGQEPRLLFNSFSQPDNNMNGGQLFIVH